MEWGEWGEGGDGDGICQVIVVKNEKRTFSLTNRAEPNQECLTYAELAASQQQIRRLTGQIKDENNE